MIVHFAMLMLATEVPFVSDLPARYQGDVLAIAVAVKPEIDMKVGHVYASLLAEVFAPARDCLGTDNGVFLS